jgi:hypothetical protein
MAMPRSTLGECVTCGQDVQIYYSSIIFVFGRERFITDTDMNLSQMREGTYISTKSHIFKIVGRNYS